MTLVLGIDTGGTYTDGVIIDRDNRKILSKAKSLTTKDDLSRGIIDCITEMSCDQLQKVSLVSLSTTLATNAIVEGRGCEVGLLTIGYKPEKDLPVCLTRSVPGGHDIKGLQKEPFNVSLTRSALKSFKGVVDAIAISGYLSVRNPEHEYQAQALAEEALGVPVVCAHHLSRSLGIRERTTTAVLNAKLLPIISDLLDAVTHSLKKMGISAPIMIVKGDGTLVGEDKARRKPIETLLSGPAASIIGATFLCEKQNALVLDMGGTTTDIAIISNGVPRINENGACVGGYMTRTEAIEISTYGLGGDSHIQLDMSRKLQIGPHRAMPICLAARTYPHLIDELRAINIPFSHLLRFSQVVDCFQLLNRRSTAALSETDLRIIEALEDGPHSIFTISRRAELKVNFLNMNRLVNVGVLGLISLTPTDLLHAKGDLGIWDNAAASLAVSKLAARFNMGADEFCEFALNAVVDELGYTCMQSLINHAGEDFDIKTSPAATFYFQKQIHPQGSDLFTCILKPKIPIIGIGAPIRAWLPKATEAIDAKLIVPDDQEVANAIGAAVGRVIETVKILITPDTNGDGFNIYSAWEMKWSKTLEEAGRYGRVFAVKKAEEAARENGAVNIEITLNYEDYKAKTASGDRDIYIESRIEAIATERPEWERKTRHTQ